MVLGRTGGEDTAIPFEELGLDATKPYLVFEFWQRRYHGADLTGSFTPGALPRRFNSQVFVIRAKQDHPQLIATGRHITGGGPDLVDVSWRPSTRVARSGRAQARGPTASWEAERVVGGDPYELFLTEPPGWRFRGPRVRRVAARSRRSAPTGWRGPAARGTRAARCPGAPGSCGSREVHPLVLATARSHVLMMALEGPYITAIVAGCPEAAFNLAAYGLPFRSPGSSSRHHDGADRVQRARALPRVAARAPAFTYTLNAMLTVVLAAIALPPVFGVLAGLMNLPPRIARLAQLATATVLPWPAAIGYRRFYQGLLVRAGLTGAWHTARSCGWPRCRCVRRCWRGGRSSPAP